MKKEKRDPRGQELLREMIEIYKPLSIKEIQDMLKDMFSGTMEDMLKAELDTELGYKKNDQQPKETPNRRNGSYPKTVRSSFGETELQIPRDRKAAFPNEMSVMKILYLLTLDIADKWRMPYPNWGVIRGKLDILWGAGWDE